MPPPLLSCCTSGLGGEGLWHNHEKSTEVPTQNEIYKAKSEHEQFRSAKMVRRQSSQCTLGLQTTRRGDVHYGKGSNLELLEEGENEHKKLG
jgi:hypothetical protein